MITIRRTSRKLYSKIFKAHLNKVFFFLSRKIPIKTDGAEDACVPSAAKYPLPQRRQILAKDNFLRYLDLCYVNPACYKLNTFHLL